MSRSPCASSRAIVASFVLVAALGSCGGSMAHHAAPARAEFWDHLGTELPMTLLSEAEVAARLGAPLTLAEATALAVGNHRAIAKHWALLASARGGSMDAWKPAPLGVHGSYTLAGHEEFHLDMLQDISSFAGLAARRGVARAQVQQAQLALLATSYQVVRDVTWAYYEAAAAQASLVLARESLDAAGVAATLAQRLFDAGTATQLSLLQAQDAHESMRQVVWQAEQQASVAMAQLARAMGVRRADSLQLADGLPEVPAAPQDLTALAVDAAANNLGVRAAIAQADEAVSVRSAARVSQFLPSLGVGVAAVYDDEGWSWGPAAAISLPLFGQGRGEALAAKGATQAALHDVEDAATGHATAVLTVRTRVAATHQRARHLATTIVPLRQQTMAAAVLEYNAMTQSPFALLAARERQLAASMMLIEATKQYWQAVADADALARGVVPGAPATPAVALPGPSMPADQH